MSQIKAINNNNDNNQHYQNKLTLQQEQKSIANLTEDRKF